GAIDGALTQTVANGAKAERPNAPVKEGYVFAGWYADSAFKTPFNFNSAISQDVTLYARFIEASADAKEFTIKLVVDGDVIETATTAAGCVFGLPTPEKDGKTFIGWWASDCEDANKLTAQVKEGDAIDENITLFAVWKSEAPAVSVTATGATWTDMGIGSQYTVVITDPNGKAETIPAATNSVEYAFAAKEAGEYSIKVSVNGKDASTTVYYNNKGLARVSQFTEKDGVITFEKVANATKYFITVQCGDAMHNHVDVDLGDTTAFDFSKCVMPEDGIKFTVKAVADGFGASISEEFVVLKKLGAIENLAVSDAGEATWTAVENATGYAVTITYAGATETITVTDASISLNGYGAGEIKISVVAEAFGYVSSAAAETTYTKATIAAPTGLKVNGDKVEWDAVDGAVGYVVKVGESTYDVESNSIVITSDMIPDGATSVSVSVMAKAGDAANNSQYSQAVEVTFGSMAATLKYAAGAVAWDAVMNAQKYEVQVNDGAIVEVAASQNSAAITFDKAGINVIKVRSYDAAGVASDWVSVEVEAFAITLNGNGGEDKQAVYKATGDIVTLEETTRKGYTFNGWYDMPVDGKKYADGFTFEGTEDTTVYAGWIANKYKVTLYTNFGDAEALAVEEVTYDGAFTLPQAVPSETLAMLEFAGWFTEANAGGIRYTYENGDSINVFKDDRDIVLYASFNEFLRYEEVLNTDGEYTYQVVGGKDIDMLTLVTVPADVNGKKVTRVGAGAFEGCKTLKKIYLPDTIDYIEFGDGGYNGQGNAFYYCSALEGIYIYETPGTHKRVYKSGEYGELIYENYITQEQTLVFVPKNTTSMVVSSDVQVIGQNVFASTEIEELTIPASVKRIESGAFWYCDSMHTLTFLEAEDGVEASLEIIDSERTFYMFKAENLTLPSHLNVDTNLNMLDNSFKTLKEIKVNATADKGGFYSVDGLLCYGQGVDATIVYAPNGFDPANGVFTVPDQIYKIGDNAFKKNYPPAIQTINVGGQVTEIGASAFEGMESLKTINFQGTKQSTTAINIGKRAFYGCTGINNLTMPVNMGTLEANAFGGITGLSKVTINVANTAMDLKANAFATLSGSFSV
ncbi:MAG: leucine-rich repeat protein, partial [Clostridia bacterium]|nr:leucine-rich repeat protein [Clostridia bacterium]